MRVQFFVRTRTYPRPEPTPELEAASGSYVLDTLPRVGDLVTFDEGDTERPVETVLIQINPVNGYQTATVALRDIR